MQPRLTSISDIKLSDDYDKKCNHCNDSKICFLKRSNQYICCSCERIIQSTATTHQEFFTTYTIQSPLSVFLSYGHDEYQQLAMKIKDELECRGHSVWMDIDKLSPGCDWERGISDGLTMVKEAQEDGLVLLLMTPHALRRPDGYCLNEVARAVTLKLRIFPVMVYECQPPKSLHSLPFFDMTDCVPSEGIVQSGLEGSKSWDELFSLTLNKQSTITKIQKLITALEMCDSMLDRSIPSIVGVEHLGLFATPNKSDYQASSRILKSARRIIIKRSTSDRTVRTESSISQRSESCDTRLIFSFDSTCWPLARRLHDDLVDMDYQVYPIDNHLSEEYQREGIKWAKEVSEGKMVLFITPTSVGRPHGTSLNDVSAAMSAGLGFIPLMIRQCEVPLSICRIQWLDMSDCITQSRESSSVNSARYEARKNLLIRALTEGLDHDGQHARLFSILSPLSFHYQTQDFFGRGWLLGEFDTWMNNAEGSNLFWITGQIGSGKTAIAQHIVQNRPEVVAVHFASRADEQTQESRRCLLSVVYQLTTQLPEYASVLQSGDPLEEIVPVSNMSSLVEILLCIPLQEITPPLQSMIVLIDGLEMLVSKTIDFPGSYQEDSFVAILPLLISKLPSWLRLVVFSREDPGVMQWLQYYKPAISLDKKKLETQTDIKEYLRAALKPYIPTSTEDSEAVSVDTMNFIVGRAEGLFLYARHIIHALSDGRLQLDNLQSFPVGMEGFMRQFFEAQFSDSFYKKRVRPVMEVLCAAFESMHVNFLRSIMQWKGYEQNEIMEALGSLFHLEGETIKPFHSSVFEWLQNPKASGPYYVEISEGHERIGKWCWTEYQKVLQQNQDYSSLNYELMDEELSPEDSCSMYIVRYAFSHLQQSMSVESTQYLGQFASDEKFQLARRLLSLRKDGLASFFHGDIGREESQNLLRRREEAGSFLIRFSSRQQSYCASFIEQFRGSEPIFRHNLIFHLESGAYSVVPPNKVITGVTVVYPDLTAFVEAYQRKGILKHAIPCNTTLNRSISLKSE